MGTVRGASPSRSLLLCISNPVFQEEPALLAHIIHEHSCCNRRFAAATSLHAAAAACRRAGSPLSPSTYCSSTSRSFAAPRARLASRLRDFATNRHE